MAAKAYVRPSVQEAGDKIPQHVAIVGSTGVHAAVGVDGKLQIAGTFSADPPVGASTSAKQDAIIALLPAALDSGRLKVALPAGGSGLTDTELRLTAVAVDPSDKALRDNGKVDVAGLDQYTPVDGDTGAGTQNLLPVGLMLPASGAAVLAGGDAANGLDVDVTRLPLFIASFAYDGSDNLLYAGKAAPGTTAAAAGWQIRKCSYSGSLLTAVQYADGDLLFNNVWNDRAGLSYS